MEEARKEEEELTAKQSPDGSIFARLFFFFFSLFLPAQAEAERGVVQFHPNLPDNRPVPC